MKKTIVTHFSPDLDAVTAVWLVKRFLPGWEKAEIKFVPAGQTLENRPADDDSNLLHLDLDTGLGRFDHHQANDDTCAAKLVLAWLGKTNPKIKKDKALERLTDVVLEIDHFREVFWPDPDADRYEFLFQSAIKGLELVDHENHHRVMEFGLSALDGTYKVFQNKVWAEKEMEAGVRFKTKWGRSLGAETKNDAVIKLAQKKGFKLVVRKDSKKGYVRIKTIPDPKLDLTPAYEKLRKKDSGATWFLHPDRHQLLNGTTHNPTMKPTRLTLKEIIEVLRNC